MFSAPDVGTLASYAPLYYARTPSPPVGSQTSANNICWSPTSYSFDIRSLLGGMGHEDTFSSPSASSNSQQGAAPPPVPLRMHDPATTGVPQRGKVVLTTSDTLSRRCSGSGGVGTDPVAEEDPVSNSSIVAAAGGGPPEYFAAMASIPEPEAVAMISDGAKRDVVLSGSIWLSLQLCEACATVEQVVEDTMVRTCGYVPLRSLTVKAYVWLVAQAVLAVRMAHLLSALMDDTGAPTSLFLQFLRQYKAKFGTKSKLVHANALLDCKQAGQEAATTLPVHDLRSAEFAFVTLLDCFGKSGTPLAACLPPYS